MRVGYSVCNTVGTATECSQLRAYQNTALNFAVLEPAMLKGVLPYDLLHSRPLLLMFPG